jgi:hypothetical protein
VDRWRALGLGAALGFAAGALVLSGFSVLTRFEFFAGSFGLLALSCSSLFARLDADSRIRARRRRCGGRRWHQRFDIAGHPGMMASIGTFELVRLARWAW